MIVQISAGQGPIECSIAVQRLCNSFLVEFGGSSLISKNIDYSGNGYKSCVIELPESPQDILGTIKWICKSPIRENHKRKNWFITVSEIEIPESEVHFDEKDCCIETMNCGGKGGQNVNKVETGVRIKHIPSGTVVECTEERSQFMNKKKAMSRLMAVLMANNEANLGCNINSNWQKHNELVRGNPIRVYEGCEFRRIV